jgi:hypothetical protein
MTNLQHFKNIASVNFVLFSLVLCFFGDQNFFFQSTYINFRPVTNNRNIAVVMVMVKQKLFVQEMLRLNVPTSVPTTASIVQMTVWYGRIFCPC